MSDKDTSPFPAEAPSKAPAQAPAPEIDTDLVVEQWFYDVMPASPASRDTEVWNYLIKAKDILKAKLKGK